MSFGMRTTKATTRSLSFVLILLLIHLIFSSTHFNFIVVYLWSHYSCVIHYSCSRNKAECNQRFYRRAKFRPRPFHTKRFRCYVNWLSFVDEVNINKSCSVAIFILAISYAIHARSYIFSASFYIHIWHKKKTRVICSGMSEKHPLISFHVDIISFHCINIHNNIL